MGSRDYSHREKKKQKKDPKKLPSVNIAATPTEVEVVRKGKKREGREPDEE
jgi:hypothetical protein